jgi:hypothetical protein
VTVTLMESRLPPTCRACRKHDSRCAEGPAARADGPSGARLVVWAAGVFLLPLVVAILATVVVAPEQQGLVGTAALAVALAATAGVSAWARRRHAGSNP